MELASGLVTPAADVMRERCGIAVVPDVLASAGGNCEKDIQ
jgi:glutamate dehydrogenase/leucine dehydrogenase